MTRARRTLVGAVVLGTMWAGGQDQRGGKMARTFKALLVAPDGDYVTDHRRGTIEEVEEALADQGSRWFFYPFVAVIVDRRSGVSRSQRLVSVPMWPEPLREFKGRTVGAFLDFIATEGADLLRALA